MTAPPIIDAHVHLIPDRMRAHPEVARADPWFAACHASPRAVLAGPRHLLRAMDEDGVDQAVCFTWPFADPALCAEANDWLAAAVRAHPDRLIGFGTVQPADPNAAEEATRCARLGLRGLGELNADAQGWDLTASGPLAPVVAASVRAGLPWTIHCSEPVGHAYPGKGTATPDRILAFAAAHADLRVVCAHLGGGLPFFAAMPEVGDVCRTQLWFDTAAVPFLYAPDAYAAVVRAVGADRVMAGSDFPLLRMPRVVAGLEAAGLSEDDRAAVLGGTASGLLNR